jgi:hypothetical protein
VKKEGKAPVKFITLGVQTSPSAETLERLAVAEKIKTAPADLSLSEWLKGMDDFAKRNYGVLRKVFCDLARDYYKDHNPYNCSLDA